MPCLATGIPTDDATIDASVDILIELAKAYSNFYNENKIILEDEQLQNARVFLTYATGKILKKGAELLGIEMPDKM